ncbi:MULTISPECIES: aminopeptidase P family protein [Psychrobacter]|jgi:Xaa-Pro aminopeptidase|uniref:aminopeptidase P family protein n=1 Tax=Psychrobacter TaxID=497 RepID=UPI00086F31E2|nr:MULTISPECIES: aminopeptidase P family protein [Psychrobacter]MBA6243594.1 aminopeptidase P family protein [Psychrobacter sp. Urea-trap-18]MBA6284859.1 aminopeptidase P family protein [Psychrobacter sp. Urea-trap-16]MBA6317319.1 aminopeptidase P family protein [Psychrobacter sp. Urea-trap-20]MBA6334942.1 aminopeptidase P family protein [Psychrobacter sp. Urea-trap-19]OEH67582.1 MAG: peptidase M24 [Psychrobacter sp. B29-1]|tara:strand:- start:10495 stop:12312 length:1818 start_codon:yes stop_codon:yes gene_type:complete
MNKQAIHERIANLRSTLAAQDLTAIIVPSADPHLSEYLPEYWQARLWLSGFTGSVGTLVVTADFAGLWTDSRYWVHAADQLEGTGITLEKLAPGQPNHIDWLADHLQEGDSVAVDGNVLSIAEQDRLLNAFDANDITLITERDVLTEIWTDRPALPAAKLYAHDEQFLAQSATSKLAAVREGMAEAGATHHLLSSLDDIAWLTNLRGADVDYNPVFLSHMLIDADKATLFVDTDKVNEDIAQSLKDSGITLADYSAVQEALSALTPDDLLLLDPSKVAVGTLSKMADDVGFIEQMAPSTLLKSVKSDADIDHVCEAMRQDGAALAEFFATFEQRLANGERLSELDVDSMLIDVRSRQPYYVSPSFPTIAGFNENGALPHYRATPEKFSYLDVVEGEGGLLLIDSGAQYQNGTTDITRVVGIGQVAAEHKRDFTIVLKAHIALARAHFPDGIASPLIDAICRAPLWQAQMDYGHGTGHGVGYFLNVHEGPQVIAYSASTPKERAMKVGMISSNEPGLYREGKWGIRIENLVVNTSVAKPTETEFGDFLNFETITYCPIDTRLIEPSLLDQTEIDWLNDYHSQVFAELKDRVEGAALEWLTERTKAI